MSFGSAQAVARSNIALVKYWGDRDPELVLPAVGSISLTLEALSTRTAVRFAERPGQDRFQLDGAPAPEPDRARVASFIDLVRERAGIAGAAVVDSENNFPTAAGLASSASGFAALALAATRAAGLTLPPAELSALARRGSGSAARSIFGGFVEWQRGERADGADSVAKPLFPPEHWALRVLVAITADGPKKVGSREGMQRTAGTSALWRGWIADQPADLAAMREAIAARDLPRLGEIAERSCLKMHATMLAARPGLLYWNAATVEVMHAVRALRRQGTGVWFTIDAGPQVKAICAVADAPRLARELRAVPGVHRLIESGPGPGAQPLAQERGAVYKASPGEKP